MWPEIAYESWRETCTALHLYCQIVGKYRLAKTPWINHSWHATFYVAADGLTTSIVPDGSGIEIRFDLIRGFLTGRSGDGRVAEFPLRPMSVAQFHDRFSDVVRSLGGVPKFSGMPSELPEPVRFVDDTRLRPYDAQAAARFCRALIAVDAVFRRFRTGFLGKVSPVHFFWGSFDLAVTRFSGRKAPPHPGGVPGLPDLVTREAYSHEVSSAGFWPGGGGIDFAAFYSYAYPAPSGFADENSLPTGAYFDKKLGEYLMPYDAVRESSDPDETLLSFLQSTYRAASMRGNWDASALECPAGEILRPRPLG